MPPKMVRRLRVLYVDDDQDNLEVVRMFCGKRWNVTTLQEARPLYTGGVSIDDFDVLFLDLVLTEPDSYSALYRGPDTSGGLKILSWVQANRPKMPTLIVTGVVDEDLKNRLEALGPLIQYFEKPVNFADGGFAAMVEEFVEAVSDRGVA